MQTRIYNYRSLYTLFYSVHYLLNEHGIYDDEKQAQKLNVQALGILNFIVRI